jgi:hypothetical protein
MEAAPAALTAPTGAEVDVGRARGCLESPPLRQGNSGHPLNGSERPTHVYQPHWRRRTVALLTCGASAVSELDPIA